jgi:hypothetical protein
VALVRTDVSEELMAFTIRVKRIGELGTTAFFIVTAVSTSNLVKNAVFCDMTKYSSCEQ